LHHAAEEKQQAGSDEIDTLHVNYARSSAEAHSADASKPKPNTAAFFRKRRLGSPQERMRPK
jgi:hypothetical protein